MSMLISVLLLQGAATAPADATKVEPARPAESKICRDMLTSSSRVRPLKVCKTRAAWQRWQRCHSATRYCAPPKQQTVTVASLPGDKLVCKFIKRTGSRLEQEKICATKRQWELAEKEAQETMRNRQSTSTLASESPPTGPLVGAGVLGGGPQ